MGVLLNSPYASAQPAAKTHGTEATGPTKQAPQPWWQSKAPPANQSVCVSRVKQVAHQRRLLAWQCALTLQSDMGLR
jgi:hypothetical protein